MKCHLLKGNFMISCTAVEEGYIPSMEELDEFCRQSRHAACPRYRQAEYDGKIMISASAEITDHDRYDGHIPE